MPLVCVPGTLRTAGKMAMPMPSAVRGEVECRARQAKADLAWLAAYQAATKSHQKFWEWLVQKCRPECPAYAHRLEREFSESVPSPHYIMANPRLYLKFRPPIQDRFNRTFRQYWSTEPSHNFGHYLNLSPIVLAVAILEEFLEAAYTIRTGGASLKKSNGHSRSLNMYINILDAKKAQTPKNLVPHPNHALVAGLMNVSGDVRRLAKLRHKASHAYRTATYNADWANVVQCQLENAVKFVDSATAKLLSNAVPRPQTWFRLTLHKLRTSVECAFRLIK